MSAGGAALLLDILRGPFRNDFSVLHSVCLIIANVSEVHPGAFTATGAVSDLVDLLRGPCHARPWTLSSVCDALSFLIKGTGGHDEFDRVSGAAALVSWLSGQLCNDANAMLPVCSLLATATRTASPATTQFVAAASGGIVPLALLISRLSSSLDVSAAAAALEVADNALRVELNAWAFVAAGGDCAASSLIAFLHNPRQSFLVAMTCRVLSHLASVPSFVEEFQAAGGGVHLRTVLRSLSEVHGGVLYMDSQLPANIFRHLQRAYSIQVYR